MAKCETSFYSGGGVSYMNSKIAGKNWVLLWIPAGYHWQAMNIKTLQTISYTEGDITLCTYDTIEEFKTALQEAKDWWINEVFEGDTKRANMALNAGGEIYGFLAGDTINLDPPRCECGHLMFPDGKGGPYECLYCKR
jgi:hypothetical protein